jgi:hypothetical protein
MPGRFDSSRTRVQPFFERAFALDPASGWLSALLQAAPRGRAVLGDLLDEPGQIRDALLAKHPDGKAPCACFECPVPPDRRFLSWCVEHPDKLKWPKGVTYGDDATRMRRALLDDQPPDRASAQQKARDRIEQEPPTKRGWWRFEGITRADCLLATDRLVVTVEGKRTEPISPATDWYPVRSQLVRNLEAARQLAHGRRWASLLISEEPLAEATPARLAAVLDDAAPHLTDAKRADLQAAYLGNMTWNEACDAVGFERGSLPGTVDDGGTT